MYYFNHWLIKIYIYIFFALMNSAHLFLDVHCSSGAKKKDLKPLLEHVFCDWGAIIYQYTYIALLL